MKANSKMIAAVLAVVVMLGCALVPLTVPVNGETEATSDDDLGEFSLETLVEKVKEFGNDLKELKFANVTLVPTIVDTSENEKVEIGDVDGRVPIVAGNSAIIGDGEHTFKKTKGTEDGHLVIEAGAELRIFSDKARGHDNEITLIDANNNAPLKKNYNIIMETGSILNIFGKQFLVISNNSEKGHGFNLVTFMKNYTITGNMSVTFFYKIGKDTDNTVKFWMKVNQNFTVVAVAGVTFYGHLPTDTRISEYDFIIEGTSVQTENGYKFTDGTITLDMRRGLYYWTANDLHVDEFSVYFTGSQETMSLSSTVNLKLTTGDKGILGFVDESKTTSTDIVMVSGFNFELKNLTFGTSILDSGIEVGVSCESFSVDIGSIDYLSFVYSTTLVFVDFGITDFGFKFESEVFTIDVTFDEELQASVDTKLKGSFEMRLGSVKGFISDLEETVVWDHTFITDVNLRIPDIDLEYKDGLGTCTIGDIILNGTVPKDRFILSDYEVDFALSIRGFEASMEGTDSQSKYDMSFIATATMDGVERKLVAYADNIHTITKDTAVRTVVGEIAIINEMPTDIMKIDVPANSQIHIFNAVVDGNDVYAEKAYISMGENGLFDSFYMELNGGVQITFDIEYSLQYEFSCEEVRGYFANVGKDIVKFSITDGARFDFDSFGRGMNMLFIYEGNANFDGGKLPFFIYVGKDATFHANGLTARGFDFDSRSRLSGTVCIDTEFSPRSHIRFGDDGFIEINALENANRDYILTLDLNTRNSGTLTAKTGCLFPTAYTDDGFHMSSDDQKNGTFTVSSGDVVVKIPMDRESFTLKYDGNVDESSQHKYGETFELTTKTAAKEGYTFYGWTDGSGKIYQSGDDYTMPARNVTLTPVYYKEGSVEVVVEGGKRVAVVDGGEADIVNFSATESNWDILRVSSNGTTVEVSKDTYDAIQKSYIVSPQQLYLVINKVSSFGTDFVDYEGEVVLYSVKIVNEYGVSPAYGQDTEMKVSLNVYAGDGVSSFKVSYVDTYGHAHDVQIEGYKSLGNGYYEVTFTTNHFSNFLVTYEYGGEVNTTIATIIGIAVILIFVFGILMTFHLSVKRKA